VIVHSEFARRELLKGRSEQIASRVRRIDQGVTLPPLPAPPQRRELRARLRIPERAFVVGAFGIMTEAKQLEVGLRAFQRLRQRGVDGYYLSVGAFAPAGYKASIRHLCEELGIDDHTVFAGYADSEDFSNYFFAADVALSLRYPSMGETSAAMLQAQSCGLPTIVNDLAAFSELPSDTVVKVKIGQAQEDEVADVLAHLAGDEELRRRLGTAARQYVVEHHSWEAVAAQYADYIYHVESTGLGDQTDLRAVLEGLVEKARPRTRPAAQMFDRTIDAFARSAGLGRVLWF
jgi:glycosyltransferase involved in cell wall biosynthesis